MFGGNNNSNNDNATGTTATAGTASATSNTASPGRPPSASGPPLPSERKSRRISSNTVSAFMASAKNSLTHSTNNDDASKKQHSTSPTSQSANNSNADCDTNNAAGKSQPTAKSTFRVGVSEDKNKRCRRTMEDTHAYLYNFLPPNLPVKALNCGLNVCDSDNKICRYSTLEENSKGDSDNGYFAIFDGHAGNFAADWCGKKLHHLLEDNIRQHPKRSVPEVLDMTFTNVDKELKDLPVKNSGCTAVCAVLRWEQRTSNGVLPTPESSPSESKNNSASASQSTDLQRSRVLYTANVGDARIVLCRAGKALRLSYDHKGSDENEGKRVSNAGGLILNNRVNGVLAVTRALGDSYIKELVTGHPYTTETILEPELDEFMILACDGLWDVCSDQEAVDHIRTVQDPQDASRMLVEHALARFSTDNLSCMVVRLQRPKKQHTPASPVGLGLDGTENPAVIESAVSNEDVVMSEASADDDVPKKDNSEISK